MSVFEGMRLLRGEPGTKVTLTIIRGNAAEPHEVVARAREDAGPSSPASCSDRRGYLRIAAFRNGVARNCEKQAAELTKSGAKHLIVDVRRTAEGPFENGIEAARAVREVRHARRSRRARAQDREPRETIAARQLATARSICRSRCS